jgi:Family of unknown function (DUF6489)
MDFAKALCQLPLPVTGNRRAKESKMKINVEIDCTPEEARTFLGLPDVGKANQFYVEAIAKAMKGAGNVEQIQDIAKNIAPMGQMGLKLFQQFVENGAAFAAGAKKKSDD